MSCASSRIKSVHPLGVGQLPKRPGRYSRRVSPQRWAVSGAWRNTAAPITSAPPAKQAGTDSPLQSSTILGLMGRVRASCRSAHRSTRCRPAGPPTPHSRGRQSPSNSGLRCPTGRLRLRCAPTNWGDERLTQQVPGGIATFSIPPARSDLPCAYGIGSATRRSRDRSSPGPVSPTSASTSGLVHHREGDFAVVTALPGQDHRDAVAVYVDDDLVEQRAHDPLLELGRARFVLPHSLQILTEPQNRFLISLREFAWLLRT